MAKQQSNAIRHVKFMHLNFSENLRYLPTTGLDLGLKLSLRLKAVRIFPRWLFKGESTVGPDGPKDNGLCATKVYCNVPIQTIENNFLNIDYLCYIFAYVRTIQ